VLDPDDPRTLATRYEIARMVSAQGNYAQAEREYRDILTAQTRILRAARLPRPARHQETA
jgi:hypothetical protein